MKDRAICDCDVIHQDAVDAARQVMFPLNRYEDMASLFGHFADPTRVRILHLLENRELCVCDIAALVGVTKSAVSHQLKALRLSKLVSARRDGQIVYYSLADEHVSMILNVALEHLSEP
ncbi:MAG: helix-turn-helix transcriptional regulator [Proteobacteria bacterium]|nr:helix-turn-helix transcriptional regulator [Pseudomonadota bacterium]